MRKRKSAARGSARKGGTDERKPSSGAKERTRGRGEMEKRERGQKSVADINLEGCYGGEDD